MQSHSNSVQNAKGDVLQGATVSIYLAGTETLATIYSDNGITAITNPITVGQDGSFDFWAANGRYDVTSVYGTSTDTYEIILFDSVEDPVILNNGSDVEIGDPGTEEGGMDINGTTYDAKLRINDIGGTKPAQLTLHRHSTTLPSVMIGARANDDTTSHTAVTASQSLFTLYGAGWTGSHYDLSGSIDFRMAASGTISATSSPGAIDIATTPDASNTPVVAMTIDESQNVGLGITTPDSELHVWRASAGTVVAPANAVLTVENNANAYISVLVPDVDWGGLVVGCPSDPDASFLEYNHTAGKWQFRLPVGDIALQIGANLTVGSGTYSVVASEHALTLVTGTAPAGNPTGAISLFSLDSSDATATLGLRTEQVVEAIGTFTPSHKFKVIINGTEYWIQLDAV